jgi:hypothetical protein
MKLGQVTTPVVQRPVVKAERTEVAADSAPKDTVEQGSDAGQMAKMATTGIVTIASFVPVTYCGVVGGAILGGLVGAGVAPLTGALAHGGFVSGLAAAWNTLGGMGKAGMVLGTLTGVAGSLAIGQGAGNLVGKVFGAPKDDGSKHRVNWKNPVNATIGTTLLTVGLAGGALGGVALVGGTAAAGTLVKGLIQHGFSGAALEGVGSAGMLAGGIGAAIAGFGGACGGAKLTRMAATYAVDPLTNVVTNAIHPKKDEHKKPELIAVSDGPITLGPNGATVVLHKPEAQA